MQASSPSCRARTSRGLGSIEGVAEAKGELFKGLKGAALACVNIDDELIVEQAKLSGAKTLTWGRAPLAQVRLLSVEAHGKEGLAITVRYQGHDYPVALRLIGGPQRDGTPRGLSRWRLPSVTSPRSACVAWKPRRPTPGGCSSFRLLARVTVVTTATRESRVHESRARGAQRPRGRGPGDCSARGHARARQGKR